MKRTVLTDGSERWFDRSKAEAFEESTEWNGSNHISLATGSQWEHQTLWRTAGGRWIVESTSQWQGSRDTRVEVTNEQAARWLSVNEYDEAHEACAVEYAALEVA